MLKNWSTFKIVMIVIPVILLISILISGAFQQASKESAGREIKSLLEYNLPEKTIIGIGGTYRIILIDSCEYIETGSDYNPLIHKVNCTNSFHLNSK